jgi:hypothetical protein
MDCDKGIITTEKTEKDKKVRQNGRPLLSRAVLNYMYLLSFFRVFRVFRGDSSYGFVQ